MSGLHACRRTGARLFERSRPLRFALVGVVNTAFSYGLYTLLLGAGLGIALASAIALVAGIVFSFATQGLVVFRHASASTFVRFVLAWAAIYAANLGLIHAFMRIAGVGAAAGGALAIAPVTLLSYFIQRDFVFRRRHAGAGAAGR